MKRPPRKVPLYIPPPPPLCKVHGIPMIVTHTFEAIRYYQCRCMDCIERSAKSRNKERERFYDQQ